MNNEWIVGLPVDPTLEGVGNALVATYVADHEDVFADLLARLDTLTGGPSQPCN